MSTKIPAPTPIIQLPKAVDKKQANINPPPSAPKPQPPSPRPKAK
jgi:hypothetical protein